MNEPNLAGASPVDLELGLVERLRLIAAWNKPGGRVPDDPLPDKAGTCDEAADEIEHMTAALRQADDLRDRLCDLLSRTAIALRGPEPPLTRWSWHDLPERAAEAVAVAEKDLKGSSYKFAGWFREIPSAMSYRLWQQGGHEQGPDDVALYEA